MDSTQLKQNKRQKWMRVLSLASLPSLEKAFTRLSPVPTYSFLRQPEIGLAMVRATAGDNGTCFNMGEVTLSRCAVELNNFIGHGYITGRDTRHAELAAVFDALLQDTTQQENLLKQIVTPLENEQHARHKAERNTAEATKVDFFTMVRGEDS